MAEGKKSIIIYADWGNVFDSLEDAEAGKLIKHFFNYVRDMNPTPPDRLTQIAFEPIKNQLKRDLKNWEVKKSKRSEAGKRGMEKRWGNTITKDNNVMDSITKITVNDNVNVNVTDINYLRLRGQIFSGSVSDYIKSNLQQWVNQWSSKNKEVEISKVFAKADKDYICYEFNNENHLKNAFKKCYEKLAFEKNRGVAPSTTVASKPKGFPINP